MSEVTVVADIVTKADQVEFVKAELLKVIEPTRAEAGCVKYLLHQDNANEAHFVFYEIWASAEALEAHLQSEHLSAAVASIEAALESLTISQLSQIA